MKIRSWTNTPSTTTLSLEEASRVSVLLVPYPHEEVKDVFHFFTSMRLVLPVDVSVITCRESGHNACLGQYMAMYNVHVTTKF